MFAITLLAALAPEVATAAEVAREARAVFTADAGALWGRRLDDVEWCFVAGKELAFTARPDGPSREEGGLFMASLPDGVSPANSAVKLAGRTWAMVMLPLPSDRPAATRLLLHEAFHVVEPDLLALPPAGEGGAGAELLERPEGRIWLQLEQRALAQALEARGLAEQAAVARALVFRARRYALAAPGERDRERLLDVGEGMAEYTAWKLAGGGEAALPGPLRSPTAETFTRSFPYTTGPAYGLLLDRRAPGWRTRLRASPDLQALLAATLPRRERVEAWLAGKDGAALAREARHSGAGLGLRELERSEGARWTAHQKRLAGLRARFVTGPTLRLRPPALNVTFDPRGQTSLGEAGTVMKGLVWRGDGGAALDAPDGALVSSDWKELVVPLGAAHAGDGPMDADGLGWKLHLPAGWTVRREGASMVAAPARR